MGAAFNGIAGTIVQFLKLPIYLDLAGSLIVGALCGPVPAMLSAALGVLILGVSTTPIAIAYMGTAVLVAALGAFLVRFGFMSSWWKTALMGFGVLGPVSTLLSVPVTVYFFGGITFVGSDLITLALLKAGDTLLEAVFTGAFIFDAIDKGIASIVAFAIFRRIPQNLRADVRA